MNTSTWPIILPLPLDIEYRKKLLLSIFSSPIILEVLENIPIGKEVTQRDLINKLSKHSNRSVIRAIRTLKEYNLLREKDVIVESGSRRVRAKAYTLTSLGRWFHLMLADLDRLSSSTINSIIDELLNLLMDNIASLYDITRIDDLSKMFMEKIVRLCKNHCKRYSIRPQVYVLGSVAIDHYFKLKSKAINGSYIDYEYIGSFPGGSGANVACNLAKLGIPVEFYGKIAADTHGLELLLDLLRNNVGLGNVVIDRESKTLEVIITLNKDGEANMNYMITRNTALSPETIGNDLLELICSSRAIYVGETFHEVSSRVLDYCSSIAGDPIIIYRPSYYALEHMIDKYLSLLRYSPILVINHRKASILESKGINVPSTLFSLGAKDVIVTMGSKGAVLYSAHRGEAIKFSAPKVKAVDTTGAGDAFSAFLIYALLKDMELVEAVRYAVAAASISTQYIGARSKTASPSEVEEKIDEVKVVKS